MLWKFFPCVNNLHKSLHFFFIFSLLHYGLIVIQTHIWFSTQHLFANNQSSHLCTGNWDIVKNVVNLKTKKISNKVPDQNRPSCLLIKLCIPCMAGMCVANIMKQQRSVSFALGEKLLKENPNVACGSSQSRCRRQKKTWLLSIIHLKVLCLV